VKCVRDSLNPAVVGSRYFHSHLNSTVY